MFGVVAALSIIAIIVGGMLLSEATMGVGVIAIGGVLAVFARIVQADENHKEIKKLLGESEKSEDSLAGMNPGRGIDYLFGKAPQPTREDLQRMAEKEQANKES